MSAPVDAAPGPAVAPVPGAAPAEQEMPPAEQILVDTLSQVKSCTAYLAQLAASGVPDNLTARGQAALTDLTNSFSSLGKRQKDARDRLGLIKKRQKKPAKNDPPANPPQDENQAHTNGGDNTQDDVEEVQMGHKDFLETMIASIHDSPLDLSSFFTKLCDKKKGDNTAEASAGVSLVLTGVEESTKEDITKQVISIHATKVKSGAVGKLEKMPLAKFQVADLYNVYETVRDPGNSNGRRSGTDLTQHLCATLQALRFAYAWETLNDDDHPTLAKQGLTQEMYRISKDLPELSEEDLQSPEFESYRGDIVYYLRGANRLKHAYETLGSLILLCPQLDFHFFCCSRIGLKLSKVLDGLEEALAQPNDTFKEKEVVHSEFVKEVAGLLNSEGKLRDIVEDVELSANRLLLT
ncbi:hypothetical protein BDV93DRAFT_607663 [Ceratobasidium sp. AG-I]|nr:hypothetical protein BDV93DRAFT_607663 [Ceratobasidium sp. AG-I]